MRGPDKVLRDVRGGPLLKDRAQACLDADACRVIVVVAPEKPERRAALNGLDVDIVDNEGASHGIAHSLQVGLRAVTAQAALVMLCDLPDLTGEDLKVVLKAAADHPDALLIRGTSASGKPGHPVVIRSPLFGEVLALSGDTGAAPILRAHQDQTQLVPLPANHALNDLDTPEDWAAWTANQHNET